MLVQLLVAGIVAPVRSAGLTQTEEPVCFRFELSGLDEEQAFKVRRHVKELDPRIWQSNGCWILKNPVQYVVSRREIDALDAWLRKTGGSGPRIGYRERAYEIWGDERALDAEVSCVNAAKLFNRLGIIDGLLNIYRTTAPPPFPMFLRVDTFQDPTSFMVISEKERLSDSIRFSKSADLNINGLLIAGIEFGGGVKIIGLSTKGRLRQRSSPSALRGNGAPFRYVGAKRRAGSLEFGVPSQRIRPGTVSIVARRFQQSVAALALKRSIRIP